MTSTIDPSKPVEGNPTTLSVRENFTAAKAEIEALQATRVSFVGTSTSSLSLGTGTRTLTTQPGLAYTVGTRIRASQSAANWMEGPISAYNPATGALTFTSQFTSGTSGTFASWQLNLSGQPGSAQVTVGNTTTIAPGSPASVTQRGTAEARIFDFAIPQGEAGTAAKIPTLRLRLTGTGQYGRWGLGPYSQAQMQPQTLVRLEIIDGSIQPGDLIFLLRWSYSGPRRKQWNNPSEHGNDRWTWQGQNGRRSGFRHPNHQRAGYLGWMWGGYVWPSGISNVPAQWGAFQETEWVPSFYPTDGHPNYRERIPGSSKGGAVQDLIIPWREMMRYKTAGRRGTERLKFVIARPLPWVSGGQQRRYQYGDCEGTIIVRLHRPHGQQGAVGSLNRVVSVTARP